MEWNAHLYIPLNPNWQARIGSGQLLLLESDQPQWVLWNADYNNIKIPTPSIQGNHNKHVKQHPNALSSLMKSYNKNAQWHASIRAWKVFGQATHVHTNTITISSMCHYLYHCSRWSKFQEILFYLFEKQGQSNWSDLSFLHNMVNNHMKHH